MSELPPTPLTRRAHRFQPPQHAPVTWGTTLGYFVAGVWALLFAQFAPLPAWLQLALRLLGFLAIFIGLIFTGVDIDTWRRTRR